ncbi:Nucleotide-binding, alpha-beta plait [Metarhizium album ARSEF 1941]|uniref:Nucleotide-binding, alpha-beta plait n=1 Tax=Metarhizium album (strain ARSEF 1941) TaxID=1081103 RepID=A0A0B2X3P2_METAS|nr:Nucleotide-binding, alpha-beta plait [Metarhizium album ARSEF 1941]KHO00969.1 Nucleotide-binding, alpha-beta plait [Metarhizium album ARSEF 1941]
MACHGSVAKMGRLTRGFKSVRKSSSDDHLTSPSPLRGGGVSLGPRYASATASPTPKLQSHRRKTASDDGTPKSTNSSAFLVGSSVEDDIFTEASSETPAKASVTNKETQLQVFDGSPAKLDAQVIYPGTACMFVANLSQPYEDKVLEFEVTKIFSQFGEVWVKIKRDCYQMPFAFCQFTNDNDAQRAEKFGKGMKILGRPCRTEMARAQSSFLVSKKSGMPITISEATTLLSQLGEVAKAEFADDGIQRSLGFPPSVLVTYKMYDARREPVRYFAQDQTYVVVANNPKRHNNIVSSASKWDGGDALMQRYDKDRRSAYVGNLPPDMTENVLRDLAGSSGEVLGVQIYKRDIPGKPGQTNCFAFVEFARPDGADDLITTMNNTDIDGNSIRVERKHSRTFETPRREAGYRSCWSTLPRRRAGSSFIDDSASTTKRAESPNRRMNYNKSFSYGQNRRPRQTIFNIDTSVGKAMSSLNLEQASEKMEGVQPQHDSRGFGSPSKKSVEFELPSGPSSGTRAETCPTTPTVGAVSDDQHVASPILSDDDSGTLTAVNTVPAPQISPGVMMPPPFAWAPFYQPYPQSYQYMAGPFTPHQPVNEGMVPSYMTPQYPAHPTMIYQNMMMPTPAMMAAPPTPTGRFRGSDHHKGHDGGSNTKN